MLKKLATILMLLTIMIFASYHFAEAGKGEGPPTGSFQGPAIVGTLTLDGKSAIFVGHCKNIPVVLSVDFPADLKAITPENIENFYLVSAASALPEGCSSASGGLDLIINTVTKFDRTDTAVIADVVVLFLVNK